MGERTVASYWGYHLIIDAAGGDIAAVTNPELIADFARTLVKDIDMIPYGEPQVVHFAEHKPEVAGYTLVQLIQTSSITAHFVDCDGSAYIDVFSCKPFDAKVVKDLIQKYFKPASMREYFITRQA